VVAPANSKRTQISFDNPGAVDIIVFPVLVQALNPTWTSGSNLDGNTSISSVVLAPTTAALGGGYRIYGNGGSRTITGECQGAWQALAISGSGNPLTVTDSNVS
jgi:N-methylhydantoinase A/oxoprolinase/acetone carboxylase beta subunit